uniref:Uncharacterized protein n=1 Tax=Cacopsylla melanoneura TaxID=428564 RepID=A0A8D8TAL2_9HEMI
MYLYLTYNPSKSKNAGYINETDKQGVSLIIVRISWRFSIAFLIHKTYSCCKISGRYLRHAELNKTIKRSEVTLINITNGPTPARPKRLLKTQHANPTYLSF